MAAAYHEIYTKQKGRDFIGMRDYYNLVKLIASILNQTKKADITEELLVLALCRNFGGKPDNLRDWVGVFCKTCFGKEAPERLPEVRHLVRSNLVDSTSRHLMVLTRGGVALPLMMGCQLLDPKKTTVLIGSEFPDDVTELKLVQQINEVKLAMASGSSIVLLNHNNIYEALYDVLNQRYVNKTDEKLGKTRRMLRLAIGTRSQLCPVEVSSLHSLLWIAFLTRCKPCPLLPLSRTASKLSSWSTRKTLTKSWTCRCSIVSKSKC